MRNIWNRLAVAAVSLMATGTVALAQSAMTVDVPFTFATSAGTMQPGKYTVVQMPSVSSMTVYHLKHLASRNQALLVVANGATRTDSKPEQSALKFACAGEYCALTAVYPAFSPVGHEFRAPVQRSAARGGDVAQVLVPATE